MKRQILKVSSLFSHKIFHLGIASSIFCFMSNHLNGVIKNWNFEGGNSISRDSIVCLITIAKSILLLKHIKII